VPVTLVMVFGVMLLSKSLGFVSQVVVTGLIGTTGRADAYYFALSLVTVVSALVFGSAGSVLIPLYVEKRERKGAAEGRFAGVILTI
jgi:peptidoglycan biosynthesis protein MviN/MurJ (putative lipid II flippase)